MFDIFQKIPLFHRANSSRSAGQTGEVLVTKYLKKHGYTILARNWVNSRGYRVGEIDIVAREGKEIIFVEVKTRRYEGKNMLPPEMFVDAKKMGRLQKIASRYRMETKNNSTRYRFDVVSVVLYGDGSADIKHLKNIFL